MMTTPILKILSVFTLVSFFAGCAHMIPGTQIKDNKENREVYDTLAQIRNGLQERNAEKILALVSKKYFEDMGTISQKDDFGYEKFAQEVLPQTLKSTGELYIDFELHDIQIQSDTAVADIRYSSRARIDTPSGEVWDSQREFNRIEFEREDGKWMITAGL